MFTPYNWSVSKFLSDIDPSQDSGHLVDSSMCDQINSLPTVSGSPLSYPSFLVSAFCTLDILNYHLNYTSSFANCKFEV